MQNPMEPFANTNLSTFGQSKLNALIQLKVKIGAG